MQNYKILWADDEIDLLKPHILFLEKKGYDVTPVNSGFDALDSCDREYFDVVFLDENMPGMSGLEVLTKIKAKLPNLPVVMITKNEEEEIMEEAIGSKITDYLIKPLNPNQLQEYIISGLPGVGSGTAKNLLKHFKTIDAILSANEDKLTKVEKVGKKKAKAIREIIEKKYK